MEFALLCTVGIIGGMIKMIGLNCRRQEKIKRDEYFSKINFINPTIPYERYQTMAKRVSVPNSPVREEGDFLDFILSYTKDKHPDDIEYKLSNVNCGRDTE